MNRQLAAALAITTSVVAIATPVQAQAAGFEIPAGNLATALDSYARQSGRQVVYKVDEVRSARTSGVHGTMSSDAALHAILKGTGFTVRSDSSGAIAIVRGENVGPTQVSAADSRPTEVAAGAPPQPIAERPAPAIVVTGSRISRRDYKAESPISTMSDATIAAAAQPSLDRVVGQMPQFEAAQGAAEVGDVQGNVGFGGGGTYSHIGGVRRNRSLRLFGSRRLMPSTPR